MKFLLLMVLFPLALCSQFTTKVVIQIDNQPLNHVKLVLNEKATFYTDSTGIISLQNLTDTTYFIAVTYPGTIPKNLSFSAKSTPQLIIELAFDLQLFEEVSITSQSIGLGNQTPYAVLQLDLQYNYLKGSPAGIMGALQNQPGINGADMGHGISKPLIRGLGFSRVATIYQGNKLENHQWGADHGLGLNDLGVQSAEIIKGPGSILYGSGAIGGVIVIHDDVSFLRDTAFHGLIGTSFNSVSQGLRTIGQIGKKQRNGLFYSVALAQENHADYIAGQNRIIGNSRFNNATARIHTGIKKEKFFGKLSYTYNNQFLGIIDENELVDSTSLQTFRMDRSMQLPFQKVTDQIISYHQVAKHTPSIHSQMDLSYHLNNRNEIETNADEIDLGLTQTHLFHNLKLNIRQGQSKHAIGLQGSWVQMKNLEEAKEVLIPNSFSVENGIYYLGTFSFENHTLQGGIRYDYRLTEANSNQENIVNLGYVLPGNPASGRIAKTFQGITGSLGYSYSFKHSIFKTNVSSGYRSPDIAELFANGNHPGTNRYELGNSNFKREQSFQYDASITGKWDSFEAEISGFSNFISNYIYFSNTGGLTANGLEIWSFNQTKALLYGGEFYVTYQALKNEKLKLISSGNLIRGISVDSKEPLTFIPADRINCTVKYLPFTNQNLTFQTSFSQIFAQNRPGFNELNTASYQIFNCGINYKFTVGSQNFGFVLKANNLFNIQYVDHISILRAFNIPSPGRNVVLHIQWQF